MNYYINSEKFLNLIKQEKFNLRYPYVDSTHVFLVILKLDSNIKKIFIYKGINYNFFKKYLIDNIGIGTKVCNVFFNTPVINHIISEFINKKNFLTAYDLLKITNYILSNNNSIVTNLLINMGYDIKNLIMYLNFNFCCSNNNLDYPVFKPLKIKNLLVDLELFKYNIRLCFNEIVLNKNLIVFIDYDNINEFCNSVVDEIFIFSKMLSIN